MEHRKSPLHPALRVPILITVMCLVVGLIFYGGFSMGAGSRTQGTKSASLQSASEEETTRKGVAKCESDTATLYQTLAEKRSALAAKLKALQEEIANLRKRSDLSSTHLKKAQERTADCERDLSLQRAAWMEEDKELMARVQKEQTDLAALKAAFFQLTDGRGARAMTTVAALSSVRIAYRRLRRSLGKPMAVAPAFQAEVEAELLSNWGPHLSNLTVLDDQLPASIVDPALAQVVAEWQEFNFTSMQEVALSHDLVVIESNIPPRPNTTGDNSTSAAAISIDQFAIFLEHHLPDGTHARPTFRGRVMDEPISMPASALNRGHSAKHAGSLPVVSSLASSMLALYDTVFCSYHKAVESLSIEEVAKYMIASKHAASHPNSTAHISAPMVAVDTYQWGAVDVAIAPPQCPTNSTCPQHGGTLERLSAVLDTPLVSFCSGCSDTTRTRMFTLACGLRPSLTDYGSFEFWAARSRLRFSHDVYDAADKFLEEHDLLDKPYLAVSYHVSPEADALCAKSVRGENATTPPYLRHRLWLERTFDFNSSRHRGDNPGAQCNPSEQQLQASVAKMVDLAGTAIPIYVSLNPGSPITLDDLSGARVRGNRNDAPAGETQAPAVGAIADPKAKVMSYKVNNQFGEAVDIVLASRARYLLVSAFFAHSQIITEEHLLYRRFDPTGVYFL